MNYQILSIVSLDSSAAAGVARSLKYFCLLALSFVLLSTATFAQKRDNLTPEEDTIIRDVQEIDKRMEVFVKVIERRLTALAANNSAAELKQIKKDSDKWGELRAGTPVELFFDIQKTLDEAIGKIDDAAARDMKNPLFPKAVRILAGGCRKFTPQFKAFGEKSNDDKEKGLIAQSIENCNLIIEASAKAPPETAPEEKKKKN